MVEPTVQVPVSLIERLREALTKLPASGANADIYSDLGTVLSQPTPTAESEYGWDACSATVVHAPHEWNVEEGEVGYGSRCPGIAEPPRIEDMALETTFSAETADGLMRNDPSRWLVLDDGWLRMLGAAPGVTWNQDSIDPSTIRDMQPPKDAA